MTDQSFAPAQFASANRIHIIGGPGTGKSTLARRLGAALDLPVHDLDRVAYEGPDFRERPLERRAAEAQEIADSDRWVAEGIFVGWTDPLVQRADLIIWLDYLTWRGSATRIISRTIRGAFLEIKARRGPERFLRIRDYVRNAKQLIRVLHASREYWSSLDETRRYPVTREMIADEVRTHTDKVLHITQSRDARRLLTMFRRPTSPAT
jgi:adenylate kinase family enzyme